MQRIVRAQRRGPAVLKSVVLDARDEARAIVERAREAATAMIEQAETQAEAIADGARARGRHAALEQARAELAAAHLQAKAAREQAASALRAPMLDAALLAAQHLLQAELSQHPARIALLVDGLLDRVRRADRIIIHAHPDDEAALRALLQERGLPARVELLTDAAIERGGCLIASDVGGLDALLQTRLAALRGALERAFEASQVFEDPSQHPAGKTS